MNQDFSLQFRQAMAHLSSAVHIVTSNGTAGKIGITVSSVTSVSDSPATLLFCVNKSSELHDVIAENRHVCVNVLSHEQADLAKHFAGMLDSTMAQRFNWEIWDYSENGLPLLRNAISNLQGEIIETHPVGSHSIFIVKLSDIRVEPNHSLIYFARQFRTVEL